MAQSLSLPSQLELDTLQDILRSFSADQHGDLRVDMSGVTFARPIGIVAVAALLRLAKRSIPTRTVAVTPPLSRDVRQYLDRIDLWRYFGVNLGLNYNRRDRTGSLCELRPILPGKEHEVTRQVAAVINRVTVDDKIREAAENAIGEVVDNVIHHSQSVIHGLVCAQVYPNEGLLEVAIGDTGIGIRNSLNDAGYFVPNYEAAIDLALRKSVTSKKSGRHSGIGLFMTRAIIEANGGTMFICTGNTIAEIDHRLRFRYLTHDWQGTLVMLRLRLDNPVSVGDIYGRLFGPLDEEDAYIDFSAG